MRSIPGFFCVGIDAGVGVEETFGKFLVFFMHCFFKRIHVVSYGSINVQSAILQLSLLADYVVVTASGSSGAVG